MAWLTPKTNWTAVDGVTDTDLNRIESNILELYNTKIAHSLATAANDFLVASGAGAFVKKTLAEVKSILGLGSAAYTASTAYATAAQGTKADNAVPIAGGVTMTGILTAQNNTSYTTEQVRNTRIYVDGDAIPTLPAGVIAFVREA